ncbi:hypothetical protein BOTBODRAFT_28639 [Botryobasidium botryosum FD-172 SS1]|uniref:F-box domain-containing protein n=1 Tax=Botryobasidium botryosum (strain FD-172 SS1) TaxID=930990 RepID=A0A067N4T6_BOTB1|nr:hypothetical protein BOTBODRAFT_28639 [Botryobasidium botryosum FD-172 SS1]
MESEKIPAVIQGLIDDTRHSLDHSTSVAPAPSATFDYDKIRGELDAERRAIETVFDAVKAYTATRLSQLGHLRNQLAPINRLPNEILSAIFHYIVRDDGLTVYTYIAKLHSLSTVSHSWRRMILDTAIFWTDLTRIPESLIDVFLKRSKQLPLKVSYPRKKEFASKIYMPRVSAHIHRWKKCTIDAKYADRDEIISFLLSPGPMLEALDISLHSDYVVTGSPVASDESPFVGSLFAENAPSLRELTLDGLFVPLTSSLYAGLTKLKLARIKYARSESLAEHLLLRTLEASPFLEELHLDDLYTTDTVASIVGVDAAPPHVDLPHLRSLEIKRLAEMKWLQDYILGHITIPPSSHLVLSVKAYSNQRLEFDFPLPPTSFIPSSPHLGLQNLAMIKELSIYIGEEYECRATGWVSGLNNLVLFTLSLTVMENPLLHLFQLLEPEFPMSPERVIFACFDYMDSTAPNVSQSDIIDFLTRHPSIRELKFDSFSTEAIQVLAFLPHRRLCPRLETLCILDCPISGPELIEVVISRMGAEDGGVSAGGAVHLRHLHITGCPGVSQADVPRLEGKLEVVVLEAE